MRDKPSWCASDRLFTRANRVVQDRKEVDRRLILRFEKPSGSGPAPTVVVMVIHITDANDSASEWSTEHPFYQTDNSTELRNLGILYKLKADAEEAALQGGDVVKAMHDRAGHGIFALMGNVEKALELAIIMMLRVQELEEELRAQGDGLKLSLQVGMASGRVLDLGGRARQAVTREYYWVHSEYTKSQSTADSCRRVQRVRGSSQHGV